MAGRFFRSSQTPRQEMSTTCFPATQLYRYGRNGFTKKNKTTPMADFFFHLFRWMYRMFTLRRSRIQRVSGILSGHTLIRMVITWFEPPFAVVFNSSHHSCFFRFRRKMFSLFCQRNLRFEKDHFSLSCFTRSLFSII